MILERETARPDGNRERAGDLQQAAKPNCPIILRLPPFPRKSHLTRAPFPVLRARPVALFPVDLVMGPPRHGDRRTPLERWQDWNFDWEGHFY
jgi:hypothetical protein